MHERQTLASPQGAIHLWVDMLKRTFCTANVQTANFCTANVHTV